MTVIVKILSAIFVILFIEAILFIPALLMIATAGNEPTRILKYAAPFIIAIMPNLIWRKAKHKMGDSGYNMPLLIIGIIIGICFLVFFTGLMFASCSGHPPY